MSDVFKKEGKIKNMKIHLHKKVNVYISLCFASPLDFSFSLHFQKANIIQKHSHIFAVYVEDE